MSFEQERASMTCPKCGSKNNWMICDKCGLNAEREGIISVGETPFIDFRNLSYADWLKSKNIYIWIKDKR